MSCDSIFDLPTTAFNLCILRGFILLFCWMNQSVTELNKKPTQTATRLKSGLIWLVLHYHTGGMWAVHFRGTTTKMTDLLWRHQWQTVTVQPRSLFTVIWVSRTTRQCCGLEEVNLCRARGWGLTLLCNLWVKEVWGQPTLVTVRWISAWELCHSCLFVVFYGDVYWRSSQHTRAGIWFVSSNAQIWTETHVHSYSETLLIALH